MPGNKVWLFCQLGVCANGCFFAHKLFIWDVDACVAHFSVVHGH